MPRLVDVPRKREEASLQRFVETASEEAVHHHIVLAEIGGLKARLISGEVHAVDSNEFIALLLAVVAQFTGYIEEEYLHPLVALLDEHPGHRQGIASIVARTSNDHKPFPGRNRLISSQLTTEAARSIRSIVLIFCASHVA